MSNTISQAVIETTTTQLSQALRRLAGITNSVKLDPNPNSVALNNSKKLPVPGSTSVEDFTAAVVPDAVNDVTVGGNTLTVNKHKRVKWHLTAEEERSLMNANNKASFDSEQMAEAMDRAVQHIEDYLRDILVTGVGFGAKTAGTNPFDSSGKLDVLTQARQRMRLAGYTKADLSACLGPNAQTRYMDLDSNNKVNEAGSDALRREGDLGKSYGFMIRETPEHGSFTEGTATGFTVDGAHSKGDKVISVNTDTGTFLAGDVVKIGNHYYVVASYSSTDAELTLNAGLLEDVSDTATITLQTSSDNRDFALGRDALWFLQRPDHIGEMELRTGNNTILRDTLTGLGFNLSAVPGVGLTQYYLTWVMGGAIYRPEAGVAIINN